MPVSESQSRPRHDRDHERELAGPCVECACPEEADRHDRLQDDMMQSEFDGEPPDEEAECGTPRRGIGGPVDVVREPGADQAEQQKSNDMPF